MSKIESKTESKPKPEKSDKIEPLKTEPNKYGYGLIFGRNRTEPNRTTLIPRLGKKVKKYVN